MTSCRSFNDRGNNESPRGGSLPYGCDAEECQSLEDERHVGRCGREQLEESEDCRSDCGYGSFVAFGLEDVDYLHGLIVPYSDCPRHQARGGV